MDNNKKSSQVKLIEGELSNKNVFIIIVEIYYIIGK